MIRALYRRSRWPNGLRHGFAVARLLGLWVRIPPRHGCLLWLFCVVSRGLCAGPITRPEESYRVWCDWVWSWILDNEEASAHNGCCTMVKKKDYIKCFSDSSVSVVTKQRPRRPENRDLITGNGNHFPSQQPDEVPYSFLLRGQRGVPSGKQYLHGSYILRIVTLKHRGNFIFTCWPISLLTNTGIRENVLSLVLFVRKSKFRDHVHVSYKSHIIKLAESILDSDTLFPSFPEGAIWRCCQMLRLYTVTDERINMERWGNDINRGKTDVLWRN